MTDKKDTIQTFEYKAEMKRLLHLIIHSLYTHPEVFLRELISIRCRARHISQSRRNQPCRRLRCGMLRKPQR